MVGGSYSVKLGINMRGFRHYNTHISRYQSYEIASRSGPHSAFNLVAGQLLSIDAALQMQFILILCSAHQLTVLAQGVDISHTSRIGVIVSQNL